MLLELRFTIAALALWIYFLAFDRSIIKITRKQLITCAALGLAGYGIFSNLVFRALESTPSTIVGLLFFCYPVFVLLLDWFVIRQRPHLRLRLGALLILGGIAVGVLGTAAAGIGLGWLLAVAGAAWYAAYIVATRKLLTNLNPQSVALYVTSFAALGILDSRRTGVVEHWLFARRRCSRGGLACIDFDRACSAEPVFRS